jgi:nicotinamide-nucleotide amidase
MIVEVIAVGTELLIGQIVNTNGAAIGERLAAEGFDAHYQVTVGDNLGRLVEAIKTAVSRSDAVILTGGIGPTQDDMTREAICEVTGRAMVRDAEHAERIRRRITARRGSVAENVFRMADHPEGAEPLPNSQGVALGIALEHDGKLIFAVPGVPREMSALLDEEIMPRLRAASGEPAVLRSRLLRTWGYGESQIAEVLDDLYLTTNPSVAFLISDMEVKVRISAKAEDGDAAERLIAPVESVVRERLGNAVFATDDQTVFDVVSELACDRAWSIAVGEAGTTGSVGAALAASSRDAFAGSITVPGGSAADLAALASSTFGSEVAIGIGDAQVVEDSGQVASVIDFRVVTPERRADRSMRFFGTGERATAYARIAALHLLRLALSGAWWEDSTP